MIMVLAQQHRKIRHMDVAGLLIELSVILQILLKEDFPHSGKPHVTQQYVTQTDSPVIKRYGGLICHH